jgi:Flp pilus assembly protein TadD
MLEELIQKSQDLLEVDRLDEAIECCKMALSLSPNNPLVLEQLGVISVEAGNVEEAVNVSVFSLLVI